MHLALAAGLFGAGFGAAQTYTVVDTGQTNCYNTNSVITAPSLGQAFYGQDAQFFGNQPGYTLSGDGKTVFDNNTGNWYVRTVSGTTICWSVPWGWPGALPPGGRY